MAAQIRPRPGCHGERADGLLVSPVFLDRLPNDGHALALRHCSITAVHFVDEVEGLIRPSPRTLPLLTGIPDDAGAGLAGPAGSVTD
jgi:hypothetical protein